MAAAIGAFDRPTRVQVVEQAAETSATTAPATTEDPDHVAALARQALPTLVRVKAPPEAGGQDGTGLTVRADGLVVTSAANVGTATDVEIVDSGGRTHPAHVVGTDPDSGLAVLQADAAGLTVADMAEVGPSQIGEAAIVVGAPSGYQTTGSVAVGVIAGINRVVLVGGDPVLYGMLEIDRPIPSTACGGAVLDRDGKVVAIPVPWPSAGPAGAATPTDGAPTVETLSSRTDDGAAPSAALAVPIDQVRDIAEQIVEHGHVQHGWLGLGGTELDSPAATKMAVGGGIAVTRIRADSPAARADIRVDDVVTAVDGVAVSDMASLLAIVRDKGVGTTITLTVMRPDAKGPAVLYAEATLVDRPPPS